MDGGWTKGGKLSTILRVEISAQHRPDAPVGRHRHPFAHPTLRVALGAGPDEEVRVRVRRIRFGVVHLTTVAVQPAQRAAVGQLHKADEQLLGQVVLEAVRHGADDA